MFQVAYEHKEPWPEGEPLRIAESSVVYEISVSPNQVRRETNTYLAGYVTMMAQAGQPILVLGEEPRWQVPVVLRLPGIGDAGVIGTLGVDAETGQIIEPTLQQISHMQELAHAIAAHFAHPSTSAS